MEVKQKKGFSLVEILIVVSILIIMMVMIIGIFNPREMVDRGRDSRRRADVGRIKTAFEDYHTGKKCYPDAAMVSSMMDPDNCGKMVVSEDGTSFRELIPWKCDPNGTPYYIVVESSNCPKWYKILVKLADQNNVDVPDFFYDPNPPYPIGDGSVTTKDYNFGGSSSNVTWSGLALEGCTASCSRRPPGGGTNECNLYNMGECTDNCFADNGCNDSCRIPCCGVGCSLWEDYVAEYH